MGRLADYSHVWIPLAVLAVVGALWELAVVGLQLPPFILPSPVQVVAVLIESAPMLAQHTLYTLQACLLGFLLALVAGVAFAVLTVQSRVIEQTTYTLLVSMNSVPKVAIAPLFIVWLGTGLQPKVAIAMLVAIFPIVVETVHGLKSAHPDMLDLARVLGASRLKLLAKIQFPHALPNLFSGMKVGIALALVGGIVGEFVASRQGLGYVILVAQGQFDTPTIFAALVILALLGTALFYAVELIERLVVPWDVSRRRDSAPGGSFST
jgi:NitT/TauT family transport system permease protein